ILLLSVLVMLRGHHVPGGGFIGGLVAASGFILLALAFDTHHARKTLLLHPLQWVGLGVLCSVSSGLVSVLSGKAYLTGAWWRQLGTPLFFDLGVYLVVVGVCLTILLEL